MIPSPSPSVKIQIMDGKCKGKTLLGDVNKLLVFKSLLTTPSNVLPLHLKETFPPIIWIFHEGEGDGIYSRLPFKIFSTLTEILMWIQKYLVPLCEVFWTMPPSFMPDVWCTDGSTEYAINSPLNLRLFSEWKMEL